MKNSKELALLIDHEIHELLSNDQSPKIQIKNHLKKTGLIFNKLNLNSINGHQLQDILTKLTPKSVLFFEKLFKEEEFIKVHKNKSDFQINFESIWHKICQNHNFNFLGEHENWKTLFFTKASLALINGKPFTHFSKNEFKQFAPVIKSLNLSNQSITDNQIKQCLDLHSELESIHLRNVTNVNIQTCQKLLQHSHTLHELSLSNCPLIKDVYLAPLIKACTNLQILDLSKTSISDETILELAFIKKLTILNLSHCPNITNYSLCFLLRMQPNLKKLYLDGFKRLTEDLIGELPILLETLSLSWCPRINPNMLLQLGLKSPNLTSLNLSNSLNVSNECLDELFYFLNLKTLDLSFCKQVNHQKLITLLQKLKPHELFITGLGLTYPLLEEISTQTNLKKLSISISKNNSLVKGLSLPKLQTLILEDDVGLSENFLITLLNENETSLEKIELYGPYSDLSLLFNKIEQFDQLKDFTIAGRWGCSIPLNIRSLQKILEKNTLRRAHLLLIQNIDLTFLIKVMENCSHLQQLELGPLEKVTPEDISILKKHYENESLQIYGYD